MTAIPDTAATVVRASHVPGPPQGRWTYDDYVTLAEVDGYRYEIIDGSIEVLALEGDIYRSLGVFQGDDRLPSHMIPTIATPVGRFFPRES
jgi:hypothetical protein